MRGSADGDVCGDDKVMWLMYDMVSTDGQHTLVGKGEVAYEEVKRIKALFEFTSSYSVVKMMEDVVIRNHRDYINHMHPENLRQYHTEMEEAVIAANKYALNYATSIQSFIDVTERQLRITKGEGKELELYRAFQSQMYDSHVEYRFWMRLRNFIVHCGFPYTEVNHNAREMEIRCAKSHLLSSGKWNTVKQDILKMSEYVKIEEMTGKMTGCISALRLAFVGMYAEDIAQASVEYATFCRQHDVREPVFVEVESEEDIGIEGFSFNPLPVSDLVLALDDLKKVPFVKLNLVKM